MNTATQYGYSYNEKLEVIEHLIEQHRFGRSGQDEAAREIYERLKSIASDYRARDRRQIIQTVQRIERALENAAAKKKPIYGYEAGNLREIAELVISAWPTIRQALEEFESHV